MHVSARTVNVLMLRTGRCLLDIVASALLASMAIHTFQMAVQVSVLSPAMALSDVLPPL